MMYRPKSNFVFGDVNLADYGGAFAFYCNIFAKPDRDVEVVSIPGRNGDLLFDNGRYKNVERRYIVQVKGIDVAHALMNDLLNKVGYYKLTDEYDTSYYYIARLKSAPRITEFVGDAVKMEIVFDRMPQRWLATGKDMVDEKQANSSSYTVGFGFEVYNRTNVVALPVLKIELSRSQYILQDATIQIRVDPIGESGDSGTYGRVFLDDIWINQSIIIDNEKKAIYDANTLVNMSERVYSTFRWMTIPPISEGVLVKITVTRDNQHSYYAKASLDTRMWEL